MAGRINEPTSGRTNERSGSLRGRNERRKDEEEEKDQAGKREDSYRRRCFNPVSAQKRWNTGAEVRRG